jgi:hypothetical protein
MGEGSLSARASGSEHADRDPSSGASRRAMIRLAREGYPRKVLEMEDINSL